MKSLKLVLAVTLVLGAVAITGCKKKGASGPPIAPMVVEGVNVDLPKLQAAIDTTGNADLQSAVRGVLMDFRYRQYEKALMDIDKLSTDSNLNEEQKKIATEVLEQIKQVAQKAPPAEAAPAQ